MITLDADDPTPIYAQLGRAIRADIAAGRLRSGEQLPTVRELAARLRINANTVAKVYLELERSGVVTTRRGAGTFIKVSPEARPPVSGRDRDRLLHQLTDRLLADAQAVGLSIDEVIGYLDSRRTEKNA